MKHITTIFFLFVFILPATAQQWEPFAAPGNATNVRKLRTLKNNVFAVRFDGVYRSADGGDHWQRVYDYLSNDIALLLEVNRFNNRLYYAQEKDTVNWKLYTSANYGSSWTYIGSTEMTPMNFIEDTLYSLRFVQGKWNLNSKLGSQNWKPVTAFPKDTSGAIYGFATLDKHLWVLTPKGIYHSPDAGYHWELNLPLDNMSNPGRYSVKTANNEVVMTNEPARRMYYSNDLGAHWEEAPWYGKDLYSSGQHLYATDTTGTQVWRFEGGDVSNWSNSPLETKVDFQLDGVGEHEGSQWLGSTIFGVLRKKPGAAEWKTVNNNLSQYPEAFRYADHCIFIANDVQTFSLDDGQTWEQRLRYSAVESVWRNGDFDYALSTNFRDLFRCPHNQRYEWELFSTLPGQVAAIVVLGDTVLALNTNPHPFYHSFDKGATWATLPGPHGDAPVQVSKGSFFQSIDKTIYRSTDGGGSWQGIHTFPFSQALSKFYIVHDTFLVSYLPEDRIFYSIDDGQSFDTLNAPQNPNTTTYRMRTSNGLLLLNTGDDLLHISKDVGRTWTASVLPVPVATGGFGENSFLYAGKYLYYAGWRLRLDQQRPVTGKVFLDLNGNGNYEFYEKGLNGMIVQNAQGDLLSVAYDEGDFKMLLGQGSNVLSLANVPPYYSVTPASIPVPSGSASIPPVYFALSPIGAVHDASANLVAAGSFRGGYGNTLYVSAKNTGTLSGSGQLKLVLNPLLSVTGTAPVADIALGDTLIWNYADLSLLEEHKVQVEVNTAVVPPETPVLVRAQVLANSDIDATNDVTLLDVQTVASFDPNDKAVSETQVPAGEADGEELTYTVRFQNLGNIETDFIVLRDTLSGSLDATSVRVLAASHPYEWNIEDGRILVFRFNPIRLAPAMLDSLRSQGFVQFVARLKPGLQTGDEIANTAHIYFDFNPAVVTNTVVTEITVVSTFEPSRSVRMLEIFPNPTAGLVILRLPEGVEGAGKLEIFSAGGRLLRANDVAGNILETHLSDISAGIYWCRWTTGGVAYWGKLVIVR